MNLLFPEDTGTSSPNPANEFQFQRLKFDTYLTFDHLKVIGKPYKWAQTLSGLSFMKNESPTPSEALEMFRSEIGTQDESKEEDSEENSTVEEIVSMSCIVLEMHCVFEV